MSILIERDEHGVTGWSYDNGTTADEALSAISPYLNQAYAQVAQMQAERDAALRLFSLANRRKRLNRGVRLALEQAVRDGEQEIKRLESTVRESRKEAQGWKARYDGLNDAHANLVNQIELMKRESAKT